MLFNFQANNSNVTVHNHSIQFHIRNTSHSEFFPKSSALDPVKSAYHRPRTATSRDPVGQDSRDARQGVRSTAMWRCTASTDMLIILIPEGTLLTPLTLITEQ